MRELLQDGQRRQSGKAIIMITPIIVIGSDVEAVKIHYTTSDLLGRKGPSETMYATGRKTIDRLVFEVEEMLKQRHGCKVVQVKDNRD